jgi:hypothetical protein
VGRSGDDPRLVAVLHRRRASDLVPTWADSNGQPWSPHSSTPTGALLVAPIEAGIGEPGTRGGRPDNGSPATFRALD